MIQSALVGLLKTVTSNVYDNVTPPKTDLPAVTVNLDSSFRNRHYGADGYDTGFIETDFEIVVWSATTAGAYNLAKSLISVIENYSGPLYGIDSPRTLYRVGDIDITSEASGFDGRTELYEYSVFITITHTTG